MYPSYIALYFYYTNKCSIVKSLLPYFQGLIILASQEAFMQYLAAKAVFLRGIFVAGQSPATKIPFYIPGL